MAAGLVEHGHALRHILADLSTLTVRDLVQLFREHGDDDRFPEILHGMFGEIVRPYVAAAAHVTAKWYDELSPKSDYRATPFVDLPDAQIDKTLGWALNAPTEKAAPQESAAGITIETKIVIPRDVTLSRAAGSAKRMVHNGSRKTVVGNANNEGVRWARLAAEDACAFCKVMALRGAVYRGHGVKVEDPGFAAQKVHKLVVVGRNGRPRGKRAIGESYHDDCRCVAVAERPGTVWTPPSYTDGWADEYRDATKAAGGSYDLKDILAEMRRKGGDHGPAEDAADQPVDLDAPPIKQRN